MKLHLEFTQTFTWYDTYLCLDHYSEFMIVPEHLEKETPMSIPENCCSNYVFWNRKFYPNYDHCIIFIDRSPDSITNWPTKIKQHPNYWR